MYNNQKEKKEDKMLGVILQPGYLPWIGFFNMFKRADAFVIFDDVQFTKRDWRTRNYIKLNDEKYLLSVPVKTAGIPRELLKINQAEIDYTQNWQHKQIETIKHGYKQAPYYAQYSPKLFEIIQKKYNRLVDLQMAIINWANKILGIEAKVVFSSGLKIDDTLKKSDRLIAICKILNINNYLSGNAAKNYVEMDKFKSAKIQVHWHDYVHPQYPQIGSKFIPYLSVIDLIFNQGPSAKKYI